MDEENNIDDIFEKNLLTNVEQSMLQSPFHTYRPHGILKK